MAFQPGSAAQASLSRSKPLAQNQLQLAHAQAPSLQISLKETQMKHDRLIPVHELLSCDESCKHHPLNWTRHDISAKNPTFHCSPLAKVACAGPKHMQ